MADQPLALVAAPAAPDSRRPHIVMVLHESTFDPALLDLPTDARFDPFFKPPGSAAGTLTVDIYGGGTWQTEFSVYAGLSSLCFGADAPFVFQLLAGRIRHSLPAFLKTAGYRTSLVTSDVVPSPSHHRFYRSIGFERIDDPARLVPPFDFASWKRSYDDGPIYEHALREIERDRTSAGPLFLSLMTLSNHGPHTRHRQLGTGYDPVRQEFSAHTGSAEFGEYMARLAASADACERFRSSLAELLDGEPALLVRFGDHHPSFTEQITGLPRTDRRLRETFFAVEPINMDLPAGFAAPRLVDAAFLSTLVVTAAGLPLDPVFATRLTLMDACADSYADCRSPMRDRFHRTLVDEGLIDLS
jgi:phosphoglycerol transferase MdoB-like AlkP superfamily enzyme